MSSPFDAAPVSAGGDDGAKSSFKKKKKKSLTQKMKKFGKRGQFGRGRQIDRDTYDYFVGVMDAAKRGFDGDDEDEVEEARACFVANVFEQTVEREAALCGNQLVSR